MSRTGKEGMTLTCIVILVALTSGCASKPLAITLYKPQPVDSYKNVQIKDGLAVAIHPILDGEDNKKYFGSDLPSNNVIPLYVVAENRHPSFNTVLLKDRIVLRTEQIEAARAPDKPAPAKVWRDSDPGPLALLMTYPPILIITLISIPFILASAEDRRSAQEIIHHLKTQEFQSRTLAPGQVAGGFVYIQLPKDAKLPAHWTIRLESLEVISQDITRFEFLFSSEGTKR